MRAFCVLSSFLPEVGKPERGGGKVVFLFAEYDGNKNNNRRDIGKDFVYSSRNKRKGIVVAYYR